jgi:hypothetical protein
VPCVCIYPKVRQENNNKNQPDERELLSSYTVDAAEMPEMLFQINYNIIKSRY